MQKSINKSNETIIELGLETENNYFSFNTINPSTERFLIDFVEDVISETRMGNLDWIVFYKTENNRQLRTCMSSDTNIKVTGIYDKGKLEKVSMNVKKSVQINQNNSKLLKVLEKLINTAETRFNCKLDIPADFIEGVHSYYSRHQKTIEPNKDFSKKKEELNNPEKESNTNELITKE